MHTIHFEIVHCFVSILFIYCFVVFTTIRKDHYFTHISWHYIACVCRCAFKYPFTYSNESYIIKTLKIPWSGSNKCKPTIQFLDPYTRKTDTVNTMHLSLKTIDVCFEISD